MTLPDHLSRVSRRHRCPVCGHDGWCILEGDPVNPSRAFCPRIESDRMAGQFGFIHELNGPRPVGQFNEAERRTPRVEHKVWYSLIGEYQDRLDRGRLEAFGEGLGVGADSLAELQIGWTGRDWAIPMFDEHFRPVGIRLRRPNGFKYAVKGSRNGLFLPPSQGPTKQLWVAEGESDTAALRSLGLPAIGRPGALACIDELWRLVRLLKPDHVVVVADADQVGQDAAERLARELTDHGPVCVVVPPAGAGDAREAVCRGAVREDFEEAARVASLFEVADLLDDRENLDPQSTEVAQ